MKPSVKKTLLSVLKSFLCWLLDIGKEHLDKALEESKKEKV